ncbi:MAG: hypothetical protein ACTHOF_09165 [Flavisolibacter sp.]|jgi:hypothetical protein
MDKGNCRQEELLPGIDIMNSLQQTVATCCAAKLSAGDFNIPSKKSEL